MQPGVKRNGDKYWEYVLCYVNKFLNILHDPKLILNDLRDQYTLKERSIKELDQYLRAHVHKWYISNLKDLVRFDEPSLPIHTLSRQLQRSSINLCKGVRNSSQKC